MSEMGLEQKREFAFIISKGNDFSGLGSFGIHHAAQVAAQGHKVFVFLVLDGTYWAYQHDDKTPIFCCFSRPFDCLIAILELGNLIHVCITCIQSSPSEIPIREGVVVSSFSAITEYIMNHPNSAVLTY